MKKIASAATVFKSGSPDFPCYTPAIALCDDGTTVVTFDQGEDGEGYVLLWDGQAKEWRQTHRFPFWHARPFVSGGELYLLGHRGDLCLCRSTDNGHTWGPTVQLTHGQSWHASSGSIVKRDGRIHLVMERHTNPQGIEGWNVADLQMVLLSALEGADLTDPQSWTLSPSPDFACTLGDTGVSGVGIPFYPSSCCHPEQIAPDLVNAPMGWLEGNLIDIHDKQHIWYDDHRSLYILARAHTAGTGYACALKMERTDEGGYLPCVPLAPSGKKMLYLPLPGGHLKFFILWDEKSALYWLVSNQPTHSARRADTLADTGVYGLPNNQRHRLQLHFSKDCLDWCFAGMVDYSSAQQLSCCYPAAVVRGDEMLIVARCSDPDALNAQRTNLIRLYTVDNFRALAY